jgi:hypothetical protein
MFYSFEVYSLKASHSFSLSHSFPLRYMAHDNSSNWTFPTIMVPLNPTISIYSISPYCTQIWWLHLVTSQWYSKKISPMISSKKHMIQPYEYLTILKDISFFLILKIGYHHLFEICRVARTEVGKMCHFSSKNGCDLPPVKSYHLSCFPKCSVYSIFTYIWVMYGVNVGKYSMHGAYGFGFWQNQFNALCA